MSVVFDRPYEFVPPHRGNAWPNFIQWFRLYAIYLRRKEGVCEHELHGIEHFQNALGRNDGILLAPNHCRYADPLVLGWPAGAVGTHLHAIASWHLFNRGALDSFAIQKMGAFSLNREGSDRKSLDTAIQILADAERPLIVFPEGATYRTNDILKPLLDGVSFIARTAARRAAKQDRDVVVLPTAIKYLCLDEVEVWATEQLSGMESHLGWAQRPDLSLVDRTTNLAAGLLALKEVEYAAPPPSGTLPERRDALIEHVLSHCESRLEITTVDGSGDAGAGDTGARARAIRSEIASRFFGDSVDPADAELRRLSAMAETVLELRAYNDEYLTPGQVTDSRIVETIQRMQESVLGRADSSMRLKVIIEFDSPIPVPVAKAPRGATDPMLVELEQRLNTMLGRLATRAKPIG